MPAICPAASKPRQSSRFKQVTSSPEQSPRVKKVATKPQRSLGIKKAVSTPRRSPRFKKTEAASEWLALDVKDIDEKKLLPGVIGRHDVQPHLPTRMVKIPFDNPDQVAVVSWRWDGDLQTKGSWNIASVIRVAKQRGIRYLFIDTISINQKLPPSDLIEQVAAFSTLYTKITVLAAYDSRGLDWKRMEFTVLRPWILNEIRLFLQSPVGVIYVGHDCQGCVEIERSGGINLKGTYAGSPSQGFYIKFLLQKIRRTSFVESIIGVLLEDIGMSFISDFRYIIHAYSHVLSVAYEQMERNDYLLTTALLCRVHGGVALDDEGLSVKRNIEKLHYSRYSFTERPNTSNGVWTYYKISLDRIPVGQWRHHNTNDRKTSMLDVLPHVERVIFRALRLTDLEYEEFVGAEDARRASMRITNGEDISQPAVEVAEVDLSAHVPTVSYLYT